MIFFFNCLRYYNKCRCRIKPLVIQRSNIMSSPIREQSDTIRQHSNYIVRLFEDCAATDHTRAVPKDKTFEEYYIVHSARDIFSKWCRQPRDDFETEIYCTDMDEADLYDPIERAHWKWVEHEIDYLTMWVDEFERLRCADGRRRKLHTYGESSQEKEEAPRKRFKR